MAHHPTLCYDKVFIKFLQSDREWSDVDANADGGKYARIHQAEVKLKSMNAALRLKKPDEAIELNREYCSELQVH